MQTKNVIEVSDDTFAQEIEQHEGTAVIDLWAAWCGPCRMIAPMLEELAGEYAGKVKVAKLDIDANPNVPRRFNVRSIPTLLFFKGGKLVDTVVGALPRQMLAARFEKNVG